MEKRAGDFIETFTGNKLYPLDPRVEEIHIEDIAHGLSLMTRFNGQCKRFFSVAQHSINVMKEVESLTKNWSDEAANKAMLLALLHDASETLGIADICAPAKRFMFEYQKIEKKLQDTVWKRFDLEHLDEEYEIVDYVDKAMSAFEAQELMNCSNWDLTTSYLLTDKSVDRSYLDLSSRKMSNVEEEFLAYANTLLSGK